MDFSYQLYSARNVPSLDDVLEDAEALGYAQVEGWGGQFADPAALAASLKNAGLTMPTGAFRAAASSRTPTRRSRSPRRVGIKTVYCPAPPSSDYRDGKGELAASSARPGQDRRRLQGRRGIGFG